MAGRVRPVQGGGRGVMFRRLQTLAGVCFMYRPEPLRGSGYRTNEMNLAMARLLILICLVVAALASGAARAQGDDRTYATRGECGGVPATAVRMAEGYCLGLVWQRSGDSQGPRMPRTLFELPNGDWLVADLGSWDAGRGAIWRLSMADGTPRWTRLLAGLSMPHTIARGPDGRIYVAEMSRIFAFDPDQPEEGRTVIEGLPDNRLHDNRHPLSAFVFQADGSMLVNVGAPSDRCLDARGQGRADSRGRCIEEAEQAMVRRYAYLGGGRWSADWTPFATGLRNSVAMAVHGSGTVYQGENSVDLNDSQRPYDEINRLEVGRHYGWPYCTDMGTAMPGWTSRQARCSERAAPVSLLPPHSAPLAMLYYDGAMFPELQGKLLISWHGYRRAGGRIMAVDVDAAGAPLTDTRARFAIYPGGSLPYPPSAPAPRGRILTPGWNSVADRQPMGAPVGMAVARDGSIWVADDRNAAVLRVARPR